MFANEILPKKKRETNCAATSSSQCLRENLTSTNTCVTRQVKVPSKYSKMAFKHNVGRRSDNEAQVTCQNRHTSAFNNTNHSRFGYAIRYSYEPRVSAPSMCWWEGLFFENFLLLSFSSQKFSSPQNDVTFCMWIAISSTRIFSLNHWKLDFFTILMWTGRDK